MNLMKTALVGLSVMLAALAMTPSAAAIGCKPATQAVCDILQPSGDPNDPNNCDDDSIVGCHYGQSCQYYDTNGECQQYAVSVCLLWIPEFGCVAGGGTRYCSEDYYFCRP